MKNRMSAVAALAVLLVAALSLPACHSARSDQARPAAVDRGNLEASFDLAIGMLADGKHREFLVEFVSPADQETLAKSGGIDGILPDFAKDKAPQVLALMRKARPLTPKREGDTRATYEVEGERALTWELTQGKWYIRN